MDSKYISTKNEIDSIMMEFDKFTTTFEQAISILSRNFIIDNNKYDSEKIDLIMKNITGIKNKKI